jgi:hypothetical protein
MNDQLMDETIVTLHPDTMATIHTTAALRRLMAHYAEERPQSYWATLVSTPAWRASRPNIIQAIAEKEWLQDTDPATALRCAEIQVMAAEACAGGWTPAQCRITAVRIDGKHTMSLVCSVEGYSV